MKMQFVTRWSDARRVLACALLLCGAIGGLAGCASGSGAGAQAGAKPDLVTDSDEPETRRRARIRLELAVGYFEQGQTTIALDELKQALGADPNFADAYNLRGLIYASMSEDTLADESFRRALAINAADAGVSALPASAATAPVRARR